MTRACRSVRPRGRRVLLTAAPAALLLAAALGAAAQEPTPPPRALRVDVKPAPPFVFVDPATGDVSGLSVDLLREVAARLEPPAELSFHVSPDLDAHLAAVAAGEADLGIAATTITQRREQRFDFSLPFYSSGLGLVVRAEAEWSPLEALASRGVAMTCLGMLAFVLLCALAVWLAERGSGVFDPRWHRGIPEAAWWAVVTMSTVGYGDYAPKKPLSRVLAAAVILAGIALFGVVVAQLTAAVTVHELRSEIHGLEDLHGRTVAVVGGTAAQEAVSALPLRVLVCRTLDEGLQAVRAGRAAGLVHDRPMLRYLLKGGDQDLVLVGEAFRRQDYGIVFPLGSPLRKPVNLALLRLVEDPEGTYARMVRRWLDDPDPPR